MTLKSDKSAVSPLDTLHSGPTYCVTRRRLWNEHTEFCRSDCSSCNICGMSEEKFRVVERIGEDLVDGLPQ